MINIEITINDSEDEDSLLNGTSDDSFNNLEELVDWLRNVLPPNLYETMRIQNYIRKK